MKKLTLALSVLAITAVASGAQAMINDRINTQDLTASQVKELVDQRGSVVLQTGPGLFDRYISSSAHCGHGRILEGAYVPTADSDSAFIGYTCAVDRVKS